MAWLAYHFEAKGIQPFIVAGGMLRHIVGGSALIEWLTGEGQSASPLDKTLKHLGLDKDARFTRRAGGVFTFLIPQSPDASQKLTRFRLVWTALMQCEAPGLAFVDGVGAGDNVIEALAATRQGLEGRRSYPTHPLPVGSPLSLRAPRTGEIVVAQSNGKNPELLDAGLARKERDQFRKSTTLVHRVVPGSGFDEWPLNMEEDFPFPGEDQTIALLHADGNRMGEIVIGFSKYLETSGKSDDDVIKALASFSQTAEKVTLEAVKTAGKSLVDAYAIQFENEIPNALIYPARPILIGGDDVTIILRADVAVQFTKVFLEEFEKQAEKLLSPSLQKATFKDGKPLPKLTACAGLVFARSSQPFGQVHSLAESLCKYAKTKAKTFAKERSDTVASCVAMHRLEASMIDDFDDILSAELTTQNLVLTQQPYCVGEASASLPMPKLEDLQKAANALNSDAMPNGAIRETASLVFSSVASADERLKRLKGVLARSDADSPRAKAWAVFAAPLERMVRSMGEPADDNVWRSAKQTPLLDALTLAQVQRKAGFAADAGSEVQS